MLKPAAALVLSMAVWAAAQTAPPAPAPQSPADGATLQPATLVLAWNAAATAVSYQVQVSREQDFGSTVVNQSGITDLHRQVGPLANGTQFWWRVRATNAAGTGAYSATRSFTTIPAPPGAVTLREPADNLANAALKPRLAWSKASGASSYRVQIAATANFAAPVVDDSMVTDTAFTPADDLAHGTTFHWRVRSKNVAGVSEFSAARRFTTLPAPPPAPKQSAPADNAAQVKLPVTVRWRASARAATYRLQVATTRNFSSGMAADTTTSDTSVSHTTAMLDYSKAYFWRVRAQNAGGNSGYDDTLAFATLEPPPQPALVSPADNAADQDISLRLSWRKAERASYYRVQVSKNAAFNDLVVNDTLSDTARGIGPLANNTPYWWRVGSRNAAGGTAFSTARKFTTIVLLPPPAPALSSPADGAAGLPEKPVLKWKPSARAASYRIEVSATPTFASTIFVDTSHADTTRATSTLAINTLYYWRVRARNAAGQSPYSEIRSFTTTAGVVSEPVPQTPKDSAVGLPQVNTLAWSRSANATSYRLQVSLKSSFDSLVFDDSALVDTAAAVGPLKHGTTYFWRVRAKNSAGVSDYSDSRRFTIIVAVAGVPALAAPADGVEDQKREGLKLEWEAVAGAATYRLQLAASPTFASKVLDLKDLSEPSHVVNGLLANTVFYWRVASENAAGVSAWSEIRSFKTEVGVGLASWPAAGGLAVTSAGPGQAVRFMLPRGGSVRLSLVDPATGRAEVVLDRVLEAGAHSAALGGRAAGLYLVRLQGAGLNATAKVLLP